MSPNEIRLDPGHALEMAIADLRGVRRARVETSNEGVESVRVLVIPERKTEEILEEVRRLAEERDIPLEPARIQVVRVEEVGRAQRRRLTSLTTERTPDRFRAKVMLELAGDVLVGDSEAPTGAHFERRTLANAVLGGVAELLDFPVELHHARIVDEGERRIAMVTLVRGDVALVGAAVVGTDEYDAVARATLDALNRFITKVNA